MNERIRELAEHAGFDNGHQDRNGNSLSYKLEKFAELIVQECAAIGERYADGNYEVPNQILKNFGLEEPEE